MKKKGDIWISAVLYMALGIIVLTIVLAAGLPVVNKMKDRQTLVQTKNLMSELDKNIRTVYNEGPSSKRTLDIKIGRGEFEIFEDEDQINWTLKTSVLLSEPGIPITEGNLIILTKEEAISGDYKVTISLNYAENININYSNSQPNILSGKNKISILNLGSDNNPNNPRTKIKLELV